MTCWEAANDVSLLESIQPENNALDTGHGTTLLAREETWR